MTELLEHAQLMPAEPETIEKVSIVISKGSLEGIYPGLIMANGARNQGRDRRQPGHAPAHLARRRPRHVVARDEADAAADGGMPWNVSRSALRRVRSRDG